ncbi:TetR/AcrR family transcriptional regulator [Egicoccus halophilus]|uniref:TetR/AcrR family transcriptional regulator n=1 Tax=Egicoccus halophilus TaxID=1670830 RepID=UPI0013EE831D|nr:TetR/AcrR family transcriptional regulator [Egicoccus halophilus]
MESRDLTPPPAPSGHRARLRLQTEQALLAAAYAEIREHGAVALSLRRVARRVGMSPAGLYRYVASRDDLLTQVITASYHGLADHLSAAIGALDERVQPREDDAPPPLVAGPTCELGDRLRAVALAYRDWGVTHPQEFTLVFGDPVPGYAAPPGGPTVAAMGRVGAALGRPLLEAWDTGRLRIPAGWRAAAADDDTAGRLAGMGVLDGHELPPPVGAALLLAWGRLHGQVSLEVFGHHRWLFPDGCATLYDGEVTALVEQLLAA